MAEAIELRGTLEGLCARLSAERGVALVVVNEARACLRAGFMGKLLGVAR